MLLIEELGMQYANENSKYKRRFGLFECPDCISIVKTEMRLGNKEDAKCRSCSKKRHGDTKGKLHQVWVGMRQRCQNENNKSYKDYGGRGVLVCDEWNNSYEAFRDWALNNGYEEGLHIDKDIKSEELGINPHIYSADTCMWIKRSVNNQKTRKITSTNKSGYRGVSKDGKKWKAQISVYGKKKHLGMFNSAFEASLIYDSYIIENNLNHTRNHQ